MNLREALIELQKSDNINYQMPIVYEYFDSNKASNITKEDIDQIMDVVGVRLLNSDNFATIYTIKAQETLAKKAEEANQAVRKWTVWAGRLTLLSAVMTIIQVYLAVTN